MRVRFTKMQGAGNDFVVLDETQGLLGLSSAQYRFLADRHFGVGADQILSIRRPSTTASPDVDFAYAIHNSDGMEVEHCGNGARCFVRYVTGRGLTEKSSIVVQTVNRVLTLTRHPDGNVWVDMGPPKLGAEVVGFDARGLNAQRVNAIDFWQLPGPTAVGTNAVSKSSNLSLALVSMGNPHAIQIVGDLDATDVAGVGPFVAQHHRFENGVNAGFMQIIDRERVGLRVFERGAGETLACGTGACAAVVAGISAGLLNHEVTVQARGGTLHVSWNAKDGPVVLGGPAQFVFDGEIELPHT